MSQIYVLETICVWVYTHTHTHTHLRYKRKVMSLTFYFNISYLILQNYITFSHRNA